MRKYQIWDKVSPVITPIGEVLTPEQWISRYPVAGFENISVVIAAGQVNGAYFGLLTTMVESCTNNGCDFTGCATDQDYLDRIEEFENAIEEASRIATEEQIKAEAAAIAESEATQERIAAALEAQVMLSLPDEEV